jgi:hypothetical protein
MMRADEAIPDIDAKLTHLRRQLDQRNCPEVEAILRRRIDVLLDIRTLVAR